MPKNIIQKLIGISYISPAVASFMLPRDKFKVYLINKFMHNTKPWSVYQEAIKEETSKTKVFLIQDVDTLKRFIKLNENQLTEGKYLIFDAIEELENVNAEIIDVVSKNGAPYSKYKLLPEVFIDKINELHEGASLPVELLNKHKVIHFDNKLTKKMSKKATDKNDGFKKTFEEVLNTISRDLEVGLKKLKLNLKPTELTKLKHKFSVVAVKAIVDYLPYSAIQKIKYNDLVIPITKATKRDVKKYSKTYSGNLAVQCYHDMTIFGTSLDKSIYDLVADPITVEQMVEYFPINSENRFIYNKQKVSDKSNKETKKLSNRNHRIPEKIVLLRKNKNVSKDSVKVKEEIVTIKKGTYSIKKVLIKTGICENEKAVNKMITKIKSKPIIIGATVINKDNKKLYEIKVPAKLLVKNKVYDLKVK